ncbi:ATP23 [Sanghuangporus vaninii]
MSAPPSSSSSGESGSSAPSSSQKSSQRSSATYAGLSSPVEGREGNPDDGVFERWQRAFSQVTGIGLTSGQRADALAEHHRRTCEKWRNELVQYSPAVTFMLERISKETGARISPSKHILCLPCEQDRSGGFTPDAGAVVLCQGKFWSKKQMEHTVTHELVHMYDHCKFDVDWSNLRHHACSEIRANSLGGDCKWTREIRRLFFNFSKQHQECVRRRAVLSVQSNPACPSREDAERAVNEVWESCSNDTRPFDEVGYVLMLSLRSLNLLSLQIY